ncbi:IclR family transcriptional regulator [Ottowia thiooxydans]|uniref:IclR family transcriptional regulator n=1 Tax=Ottowia thiooxydans TaxID=219182 RepID=UPI003393CB00
MRILEIIAKSTEGVGLAQLSQSLVIPKTSLFNMLRPLVAEGYLLQLESGYVLGPSSLRLSFRASRHSAFLRSMRPALELYASRLGETTAFVMLDETQAHTEYMEVAEGSRAIRYVVRAGETRPLYCTSAGLAVMAWQPAHQVTQYLETTDLQKVTPQTVIDRAAIMEKLEIIRREGVCVTKGEYSEDVCGIAAPVFCRPRPDLAVGAVTTGIPMHRATVSQDFYTNLVKKAAADISAELVRSYAPS